VSPGARLRRRVRVGVEVTCEQAHLTGVLLVLLVLLAACAGQAAPPHDGPPPAPTLPELTPGEWTAFSPGGETGCADGSPYTFYVRPGTVNKVVVDFRGRRRVLERRDLRARRHVSAQHRQLLEPRLPRGQPLGFTTMQPGKSGRRLVSRLRQLLHRRRASRRQRGGLRDRGTARGRSTTAVRTTCAVLSWVEREFGAPEAVFVTGCSAGAYGAALYTPRLAERTRTPT
jgi:hypothetical protein